MDREEKTNYWLTSAENDWVVANHLFEKGDYPYALFFGHLTLEKILKGIFVRRTNESPPLTHRLVFLSEKSGLPASSEFTKDFMSKIEEFRNWLLLQIKS